MNNLTVKEKKVMDAFALEGIKDQLSGLMGNNLKKIESFKTKILKISLNYGMEKCSPESIINCGLQSLMVNLPLIAGQGYVVNYGGQASFDCGYKGWQILAKRAGFSVQADSVYSCDDFNQGGFGFNREMTFVPNYSERKPSDDKWAKDNLFGVIVSIMEDETKVETHAFVDADMIFKIIGKSPSAGKKDKYGKLHSPHDNWADQMFRAKAIKQVLSKFPIDIEKGNDLMQAVEFVNQGESVAQEQAQQKQYPDVDFDTNYPKWKDMVRSGAKTATSIITQLTGRANFTAEQLDKLYDLKKHEPIESEVE